MFPRILKQNKNSKIYQYLVISQSVRKNGLSTTDNIANLGNLKNLKRYDIENLIDGLIKIFQLDKYVLGEEVEILESLLYGSIMIWQKLWRQMKLSESIRKHLRQSHPKLSIAVEKYVELMTINRCIEPLSKLGVTRWFETTCYKEMQGYSDLTMEANYFYRSMDCLVEMKDALELAIYDRLQNLFSINIKLTFYDITSTFFYGDKCPLSEPGYSRDHRPDCDQVVVGVVTSYEGYPLKHYVFMGGTVDSTTVEDVVQDLKQAYHIEETVFVGDRGMITKLNLERIEERGFDYIMGVKLRQDALCQMLFERNEIDWKDIDEIDELNKLKVLEHKVSVKDFLLWKTETILKTHHISVTNSAFAAFSNKIEAMTNEDDPTAKDFKEILQGLSPQMDKKPGGKIWQVIKRYKKRYERVYRLVFCLNSDRRVSARLKRKQQIEKLSQAMDGLFSEDKKIKEREKADIDKAIGKIFEGYKSKFKKFFEIERDPADSRALGYVQNMPAIEDAEQYDGVFTLLASQEDLAIEKVVNSYKNLKEVETLFDDFKNFVDVRPFRHRLEIRVRGHVFICILALLLKRIFEVDCMGSKSVTVPLEEIDKVKLVRYKIKFSTREDRHQIIPKVTMVNPMQKKYFNQVGIKNPMNIEKFLW
ncbi:MAG: IS1634 family transposase [candidate division Zixibacteria bacterium]|nr:IS1634 family transposase [candidate division Zixibacteria bacterium]